MAGMFDNMEAWENLKERQKENDAYWKGYRANDIKPLLTPEQRIYALFTILIILLGIFVWILGTIIIRSVT